MNTKRTKLSYEQKAQALAQNIIANFDHMKLSAEERLQALACSDTASVALSDKRAYFGGDYFGAMRDADLDDIIHVNAIHDVRLKKRHQKGTLKKIFKYLLFLLVILCINLWTNNWYNEAVDDKRSANRKLESLKEDSNYYYDSNFYDYYLTNNDNFSRINPYSASEIEARRQDSDRIEKARLRSNEMEDAVQTKALIRIGVIALSVIMGLGVFSSLLHFLKNSKIMVMEFDCHNRKLGIEIRDLSKFAPIRNVVLLARPQA